MSRMPGDFDPPTPQAALERSLLKGPLMKESGARAWRNLPAGERVRCIVVENGSSPITERHADGFDETIAIAQLPGELPAAFAQRAMARVAGVERSGRYFESITVLTGGQHDSASLAARRLLVLGMSEHARAHHRPAELLLQAHAQATAQERSALLELVGEVTEASESVAVRLCFGESPRKRQDRPSGVFAKPVRGEA